MANSQESGRRRLSQASAESMGSARSQKIVNRQPRVSDDEVIESEDCVQIPDSMPPPKTPSSALNKTGAAGDLSRAQYN